MSDEGIAPAAKAAGSTRVAARAPTRSLVMWSGGLDSTWALVRLLEGTDDEVFAHHVYCHVRRDDGRAHSRRCEHEADAVSKLLPALRGRYRAFAYSDSRVDLSAFPAFARESTTMMFFAAQAAMSFGLTPFDRIVFGANADEDRRWQPDSELYRLRRLVTIRVLKAVWEVEEVPYFYLWNPRPAKAAVIAGLPGAIAEAAASCRDPVAHDTTLGETRFDACGECVKCRALAAAAPPVSLSA